MDAEIVNVIIAVAVIYFVVKWATAGQSASPSLHLIYRRNHFHYSVLTFVCYICLTGQRLALSRYCTLPLVVHSGGSDSSANATGGTDVVKILGFKPKKATPDMVSNLNLITGVDGLMAVQMDLYAWTLTIICPLDCLCTRSVSGYSNVSDCNANNPEVMTDIFVEHT